MDGSELADPDHRGGALRGCDLRAVGVDARERPDRHAQGELKAGGVAGAWRPKRRKIAAFVL